MGSHRIRIEPILRLNSLNKYEKHFEPTVVASSASARGGFQAISAPISMKMLNIGRIFLVNYIGWVFCCNVHSHIRVWAHRMRLRCAARNKPTVRYSRANPNTKSHRGDSPIIDDQFSRVTIGVNSPLSLSSASITTAKISSERYLGGFVDFGKDRDLILTI